MVFKTVSTPTIFLMKAYFIKTKKFIFAFLIIICLLFSSIFFLSSANAEGMELTFLGGIFDYFPLSGFGKENVTSGYGGRIHPIYGNSSFHAGIDIGAPTGTPIHACSAGVVIVSTSGSGTGEYIVIDHGEGVYSEYMHQSQRIAQVGDHVAAGDVIGLVGSTGDSTGPHLHLGVILSENGFDVGNRVDPTPYLFGNRVKEIDYSNPVCMLAYTKDPTVFEDETAVIAQHGNLYLLEYDGVEFAKKAYAYYSSKVEAISYDYKINLLDYYVTNNEISEYKKDTKKTKKEDLEFKEAILLSHPITTNKNPLLSLEEGLEKEKVDELNQIALIGDFKEQDSVTSCYQEDCKLNSKSLSDSKKTKKELKQIQNEQLQKQKETFASFQNVKRYDIVSDDCSYRLSSLYCTIEQAIHDGAKVIVLPEGFYQIANNPLLEKMVKKATKKGVVFLCPAGDASEQLEEREDLINNIIFIGSCNASGVIGPNANYGEIVQYAVSSKTTYEGTMKAAELIVKKENSNLSMKDLVEKNDEIFDLTIPNQTVKQTQTSEKTDSISDKLKLSTPTTETAESTLEEQSSDYPPKANESVEELVGEYLDYMLNHTN